MSHYRFGVSPPGYGFDCFRTYEMLLLGVIPIIEERDPESHHLFRDLPVVHMPDLLKATSKQQIVDNIQGYIASDQFQHANFDNGWARLFLKYRRQQLLRDTGRDKETIFDKEGREYYQAYHYSLLDPNIETDFFLQRSRELRVYH